MIFFVQGIDGSRVEKVLESVHIAANKNTVPGDVSAMVPGGIRMGRFFFFYHIVLVRFLFKLYLICLVASGTPALTSRGFVEEDFVKVAEYFDAAVTLAVKIKAETKGVKNILYLATTTLANMFVTSSMLEITNTWLYVCFWQPRDKVEGLLGHNAV